MARVRFPWILWRGSAGWPTQRGMRATAVAALLALAGCAQGPSTQSTTHGVLPHFSDWRIAYLAPDGRAHIITQDGKTDLTGPALPDLTSHALVFSSAGVAPDGKLLAYAPASLDLVDLTGRTSPRSMIIKGGLYRMLWSPDGTKLLSYEAPGEFFYLTLATGQVTSLAPGQDIRTYQGWIDNSHILVASNLGATYETDGESDQTPTSVTLDSLDITTKQVRTIATIHYAPSSEFVLAPDGSRVLYYNEPWRDFPFTPQAGVVNLATGDVTPLPHIAQATGTGFTSYTWRPGTQQVAVTTQTGENRNGAFWLLDLQHDAATSLGKESCVLSWTPDGRGLLLSNAFNGPNDIIDDGPNDLSIMTFGADGHTSTTVLTHQAMTFPVIGAVRNP